MTSWVNSVVGTGDGLEAGVLVTDVLIPDVPVRVALAVGGSVGEGVTVGVSDVPIRVAVGAGVEVAVLAGVI